MKKRSRWPRRPTIMDVAMSAGVSKKTVSRVHNGEPNVRPATRERVLEASRQLNYTRNISARRLASQRSFIVAMLYHDDEVNHYLPDIQHGALERCHAHGYSLLVHPFVGGVDDAADEVRNLANQALFDGLIVTPPLADSKKLSAQLGDMGLPFVRVSQLHRGEYSSSVSVGDEAGAYAMTEHLAKLGHRHVGFIIGNPNQGAAIDRLNGFRAAVRDFGLETKDGWVEQGDFKYESGILAATKILAAKSRPTAIFASNDDMAAGALFVAHRQGFTVPDDLTVVGFDDIAMSQRLYPPLTTVRQPTKQVAAAATEMLVQSLVSGDTEITNIELPTELVVRESCCPPPGQG